MKQKPTKNNQIKIAKTLAAVHTHTHTHTHVVLKASASAQKNNAILASINHGKQKTIYEDSS